jgi:dihydrodipicolinate synthase/N-acetylneuraminate lyase
MKLEGVFLPVTTPFESGQIATRRLADNLRCYQNFGIAGFLVLGSTGEAVLLEPSEKMMLVESARAAASDLTLIVGVGLESTAATARLARQVAEAGADAVLVVTPFYFRTRMSEEALIRHYTAVAEASPVPILLYNVPVYTGLVIPPRAVERLAAVPNVAGLKDSAGDLGWLLDVLARVPDGFGVLCGAAGVFLAALEAGACGGVLAAADVLPEAFVRLYELHVAGRRSEALALQARLLPAVRSLVTNHGVAGVKAALDLRGLWGGEPRLPLLPLDHDARDELHEILAALTREGILADLHVPTSS